MRRVDTVMKSIYVWVLNIVDSMGLRSADCGNGPKIIKAKF